MKQQATVADALALALIAVDELVVATTRDTHGAIARRTHGLLRRGLGPAGAPAELMHRGIAALVYGSIGLSLRGAGSGLARVGASGAGPGLEESPSGRFLSSAVNGLIGEELQRERPHLAIEMGVRRDGRDVDLTPDGVAAAFPSATPRLAVFVHGLCESEDHWSHRRDAIGTTYGEMLAGHGWTPVFVRANTGLSVRENGVALAAVLQPLVDAWPDEVERIALIGHSMGGLVARAALGVRTEPPGPRVVWTDRVSDLVCLSTPHLGAPLARGAARGMATLNLLPESRAFGTILDRRSLGIRDLEQGLGEDVVAPPHVRYRLVSASLTRAPQHPLALVLGDMLVPPASATGRGPRNGSELFPGAERVHLGRTGHFAILNHPDVHRALTRWLVDG